jgi:ribosomal protein S18 acetylase RimI-like enzyme
MFREEPRESDLISVHSILQKSGFFNEEEVDMGTSLIQERLQKGTSCGYFFEFLEEEHQLIGYTCFGPIPGTTSSFDLYWIAVDTAHRGKGIGSRLMLRSEASMRSMRARNVYIETSSSPLYLPTRSFYIRNGYTLEAELKDYYKKDDNKLIYVKQI